MATERTPDRRELDRDTQKHIRAVLEEALDNYASWLVAEALHLDADACELWIDALYDNLREQLSPERRLQAIIVLLADEASRKATAIVRGVKR